MVQVGRSLRGLALFAVLAAALPQGGCSLQPRYEPEPAPAQSRAPYPLPPQTPYPAPLQAPQPSAEPAPARPPGREFHLSSATRSLVTQARTQTARGDLPGASSTLDRALRIEPGNPLLWIELGRLRLVDGDARQAEGCGRKALALASGDRGTQTQAGRLLADALRAQQRNQEAREIERQPFMN